MQDLHEGGEQGLVGKGRGKLLGQLLALRYYIDMVFLHHLDKGYGCE